MNAEDWATKHFDRQRDRVLITGASSGIGLEYLKAFVEMDCRCIATSNDAGELARACRTVNGGKGEAVVPVVADLATPEGVKALLSSLDLDRIGVLINNAGFGLKGPFLDHDPHHYEAIIGLNAVAPTLLTRSILPRMLKSNRGLLIHVASVNACTPIGYSAVYTATKAYVLYFAYALAYELKGSRIVFQIALPGTTKTPFHARQGAVPSAMYMEPDLVVRRSLARVDSLIHVSNRLDRLLFPVISALPFFLRVRLGTYLLKKRLKLRSGPAGLEPPLSSNPHSP